MIEVKKQYVSRNMDVKKKERAKQYYRGIKN